MPQTWTGHWFHTIQVLIGAKTRICLERSKAGGKGGDGIRRLDNITDSTDMRLSKLLEIVKEQESWYAGVHGVTNRWAQLSYWTTTTISGGEFHFVSRLDFSLDNCSIFTSLLPNSLNRICNSMDPKLRFPSLLLGGPQIQLKRHRIWWS